MIPQPWPWLACVVACVVALALSAAVARRERSHRAVALALGANLVIDLAVGTRETIGIAAHLAHVAKPWTGGARALYHASNFLVSAWPLVIVALVIVAFAPRARWLLPVLIAPWLVFNLVLMQHFPMAARDLQRAFWWLEGAAVALSAVAIALGWRGDWGAAQKAAGMLVVGELVIATVGPYRLSIFQRWDLAQIPWALTFVALSAVSVRWLRRTHPRR